MRFQNMLENYKLGLCICFLGITFLFTSNLFLIWCWHHSVSKITVIIPPKIPLSGLTLNEGDVSDASVYSFAYYVWQGLNYWPNDGAKDYKINLQKFSPFLTAQFRGTLDKDYRERYSQDEIQERIRTMLGANGNAFKSEEIEKLSEGTWIVHLRMQLNEFMKTDSNRIKDVTIDYFIRVVKFDVNSDANPWGLALDGFSTTPVRLKTSH